MNTSVSPLPISIWPMLGLSLALVSLTSAAVTISGHRANQIYLNREQPEIASPALYQQLFKDSARRTASRPTARLAH